MNDLIHRGMQHQIVNIIKLNRRRRLHQHRCNNEENFDTNFNIEENVIFR